MWQNASPSSRPADATAGRRAARPRRGTSGAPPLGRSPSAGPARRPSAAGGTPRRAAPRRLASVAVTHDRLYAPTYTVAPTTGGAGVRRLGAACQSRRPQDHAYRVSPLPRLAEETGVTRRFNFHFPLFPLSINISLLTKCRSASNHSDVQFVRASHVSPL